MSDILLMEMANLFIGSDDPSKSKSLSLQTLALPTLEYDTVEHRAGGAPLGVNFSMGQLKPLEVTFKLAGFDEDSYAAAGIGTKQPKLFTARGVIRRKSDGKAFQSVAVIKGTISKVAPDAFEAAKLLGHDHAMADITRYTLTIGNRRFCHVDFFTGEREQFGVNEFAEIQAMLGLV